MVPFLPIAREAWMTGPITQESDLLPFGDVGTTAKRASEGVGSPYPVLVPLNGAFLPGYESDEQPRPRHQQDESYQQRGYRSGTLLRDTQWLLCRHRRETVPISPLGGGPLDGSSSRASLP